MTEETKESKQEAEKAEAQQDDNSVDEFLKKSKRTRMIWVIVMLLILTAGGLAFREYLRQSKQFRNRKPLKCEVEYRPLRLKPTREELHSCLCSPKRASQTSKSGVCTIDRSLEGKTNTVITFKNTGLCQMHYCKQVVIYPQ